MISAPLERPAVSAMLLLTDCGARQHRISGMDPVSARHLISVNYSAYPVTRSKDNSDWIGFESE